MTNQEELRAFQTLVKMIERELELAGRGEIAELQAAVAETGAYLKTLPMPPPESARALIERARAMRARVTIEADRLSDSIAISRSNLRRRRSVARTYQQPAPARRRYSASA